MGLRDFVWFYVPNNLSLVAIDCIHCNALVVLSNREYNEQLMTASETWKCPICGNTHPHNAHIVERDWDEDWTDTVQRWRENNRLIPPDDPKDVHDAYGTHP